MKKLSTIMLGMMTVSSAFALDFVPLNPESSLMRKDFMTSSQCVQQTRATENSLDSRMWGYCCMEYSWIGFKNNITDLRVASQYNENIVNLLAGKKVERLAVAAPVLQKSKSLDMTLFITYDLTADPVAEIDFNTKGSTLNRDGSITTKYEVVELPESFTIEAGKPFYVGYSTPTAKSGDYPISYDGIPYDGIGLVYTCKENDYEWEDGTGELGSTCVYVGLDEPANDMVRILQASIPGQIPDGGSLEAQVYFYNIGGNDVTSLTATTTIGEQESSSFTASKDTETLYKPANNQAVAGDVPSHSEGLALVQAPVLTTGVLPVSITLDKINGNNNLWTPNDVIGSIIVLKEGTGYQRNVVIEEGTGTWCGWCVRGYVGMEYMAEKYTDGTYIGIAVHSGDAMESESYSPMVQNYFSGFPSAVVNRSILIDPNADELETAYLNSVAMPAYAKIDVNVDAIDGSNLKLTSSSEFALSEPCLVAYVLKEDNVGPYSQSNYYAGGGSGAMGGFENKGQSVRLRFNEVARDIFDAFGLEESLPADIEPGKEYTHSAEISLENVKDIEKGTLVAMIINQKDGSIVNASQVKLNVTGVDGVKAEASSKVSASKGLISVSGADNAVVYTLDGRRVAEIAANSSVAVNAGIYVVRTAGSAVKVVVK